MKAHMQLKPKLNTVLVLKLICTEACSNLGPSPVGRQGTEAHCTKLFCLRPSHIALQFKPQLPGTTADFLGDPTSQTVFLAYPWLFIEGLDLYSKLLGAGSDRQLRGP